MYPVQPTLSSLACPECNDPNKLIVDLTITATIQNGNVIRIDAVPQHVSDLNKVICCSCGCRSYPSYFVDIGKIVLQHSVVYVSANGNCLFYDVANKGSDWSRTRRSFIESHITGHEFVDLSDFGLPEVTAAITLDQVMREQCTPNQKIVKLLKTKTEKHEKLGQLFRGPCLLMPTALTL